MFVIISQVFLANRRQVNKMYKIIVKNSNVSKSVCTRNGLSKHDALIYLANKAQDEKQISGVHNVSLTQYMLVVTKNLHGVELTVVTYVESES